jgi:hypothetical protein
MMGLMISLVCCGPIPHNGKSFPGRVKQLRLEKKELLKAGTNAIALTPLRMKFLLFIL